MKLLKKLNDYQFCYYAIFKCEFCGHKHKDYGYKSRYFIKKRLPWWACKKCNTSTKSGAIIKNIEKRKVVYG